MILALFAYAMAVPIFLLPVTILVRISYFFSYELFGERFFSFPAYFTFNVWSVGCGCALVYYWFDLLGGWK